MSLVSTYENFSKINTEFIDFIDELIINNFNNITDEKIKMNLSIALKNYEDLKYESDEIATDNENEVNLNDLRYLIMSGLFLVSDLNHFYNLKELERFKMRAVNYINHNRNKKF